MDVFVIKTNVYIDRYTPVEGAVGDLNTIYKLEISMVSNVIQPYDVLNNYTGILYKWFLGEKSALNAMIPKKKP